MKLNDTNGSTKTIVSNILNRDFLHRDEMKNNSTLGTTVTNTVGVCTRRKIAAAAAAADIDNNNDNFDKTAINPTQGDTLNQIKAMRRRYARVSTNVSPVTGL